MPVHTSTRLTQRPPTLNPFTVPRSVSFLPLAMQATSTVSSTRLALPCQTHREVIQVLLVCIAGISLLQVLDSGLTSQSLSLTGSNARRVRWEFSTASG